MLKVNFKDGTTLAFDLAREDDVQQWLDWVNVKDFQEQITGIGIIHNKHYYAMPYPKKFRCVRFEADLLYNEKKDGIKRLTAERLDCFADDAKISLTVYVYNDPPPPIALKIEVSRLSKRRWTQEI